MAEIAWVHLALQRQSYSKDEKFARCSQNWETGKYAVFFFFFESSLQSTKNYEKKKEISSHPMMLDFSSKTETK